MRKRLVNIVLNDFTNDSRVLKHAVAQGKMGFEITVAALKLGDLPATEEREYFKVERHELGFKKMPKSKLVSLFIYLKLIYTFIKKYRAYDVWHCNDLEPLLMAWLAKKVNRKLVVVYDAHEYQRERNGRKGLIKFFTRMIEPVVIKAADEVITVSEGIVNEYKRLYKLPEVHLIFNAPNQKEMVGRQNLFREKFAIPEDHTIFLYQGAFTIGRGVDILIDCFAQMETEKVSLVFLGSGMFQEKVDKAAKKYGNIYSHPSVPYNEIINYSSSADYGLNSVENVCLSYYYCMPNKLFEYVQARIPIITTPLKDCTDFVRDHQLGLVIPSFEVDDFKATFIKASKTEPLTFRDALNTTADQFNWENEEKKLQRIYQKYLS